jgi:hypothetical protein
LTNFDYIVKVNYPSQQQLLTFYLFAATCDGFLLAVADPFSCKNSGAAS